MKTIPDVVVEDEEEGENKYTRRFRYLSVRLMHYWNQWRGEYLTDLHEFHQRKVSESVKPVRVGDVVTVYKENKKRGNWKMAVVESLIKGRDTYIHTSFILVPKRLFREYRKKN